jgi:hypothetical protein
MKDTELLCSYINDSYKCNSFKKEIPYIAKRMVEDLSSLPSFNDLICINDTDKILLFLYEGNSEVSINFRKDMKKMSELLYSDLFLTLKCYVVDKIIEKQHDLIFSKDRVVI